MRFCSARYRGREAPANNDTHDNQTRSNEQIQQRFHHTSQLEAAWHGEHWGGPGDASLKSSRGMTLVRSGLGYWVEQSDCGGRPHLRVA